MWQNFEPGVLVKLRDDAWNKHEVSGTYECRTLANKYISISRAKLCGQLAEIIKDDYDDCYHAWLPFKQVFINCFKHRFEKLK
jgi:hypothetical protein